MRIIDFHTHIFPPEHIARREELAERDRWFGTLYGNPKARMATAEDLAEAAKKNGISRSVAFAFPWHDAGLLAEGNDYVFESACHHPDAILPFVTITPSDAKATERELTRTRPAQLQGIGELMPDANGYRLNDLSAMSLPAKFAVETHKPILTHTSEPFGHIYPGKGKTHSQEVLELAQAFPELLIVCGHWGGGLLFYELQPELAAILRNVHYDTSASCFLYRKDIYRVAAAICPEKVLFGSDFPACPVKRQLREIELAAIDESVRAGMLALNAERVLGLGDSA